MKTRSSFITARMTWAVYVVFVIASFLSGCSSHQTEQPYNPVAVENNKRLDVEEKNIQCLAITYVSVALAAENDNEYAFNYSREWFLHYLELVELTDKNLKRIEVYIEEFVDWYNSGRSGALTSTFNECVE